MIWKSVRAENRRSAAAPVYSAAALRENPESLRSQRLGATNPAPRRYMPVQVRKCAKKAQNTPKPVQHNPNST